MNSYNRGWVTLINFLSIAVILGILTLHRYLPEQYYAWVRVIAIGMILVGFAISGFNFFYTDHYKNVYDFEPTKFLGRNSTGLKVRTTLTLVGGVSFWTGMAGVITLAVLK